jgi:hypothetical protein
MKIADAYIVWKEPTECWAVNHGLGRNSHFTIPDGYAFQRASGRISPSRHAFSKTGELRVIKASPQKLLYGMLALFHHIVVDCHVEVEATHCAFLAIDEYRDFITPNGYSYAEWFGEA